VVGVTMASTSVSAARNSAVITWRRRCAVTRSSAVRQAAPVILCRKAWV